MFWKKGQGGNLLSEKSTFADKSLSSLNNFGTLFRFKSRKSTSIKIILLAFLIIISTWLYFISLTLRSAPVLTGQDRFIKELELSNYDPSFVDYLRELIPSPPEHFNVSEYFIHSENYEPLLQKYGLETILSDLSFQERCDLYFNELYNNEPNWNLDPNLKFNNDVEQLKSFSVFHMDHVIYDSRELGIDPSELHFSEEKEEEIRQKYSRRLLKTRQDEQSLHSHLTHLKVFNKCFITSNQENVQSEVKQFEKLQKEALKGMKLEKTTFVHSTPKQNFSSCSELEGKVYPWLTGSLPKYIRWDGTLLEGEIPKMCQFIGGTCKSPTFEPIMESSLTGNKPCFLNIMRQELNGKGIALTIENRHVEIASRLIRLLRYYGNSLPIQIVYIKGVSEESRYQLIQAARAPFTDSNGNNLKEQELWFVDVSRSIKSKYYLKFRSFGNKILATLFNSFEELMLLDSDTVMFQPPQYFFNLSQYKKYGAFFYRDRSAEFRAKSDSMFFRKMMPSLLDTALFDIPQVTNHTLNRELFNGLTHYTESGLVMLNRKRHFLQALMMAHISFMAPIQKRVYGDKELFFLALTIYGEESYEFNKHFAAAIGVHTPLEERLKEVKVHVKNSNRNYIKSAFVSKEICSNHPAHINDADDHTLLWINSGFKHCGQAALVNYRDEFRNRNRYLLYDTVEKFKQLFNLKLEIKEAIIPPFDEKLGLEAHNDDFEPAKAWNKLQHSCTGYTWCAYSLIGGDFNDFHDKKTKNNFQKGIHVTFTKEEIKRFNALGDIWMSDFDFRSEKQIYHDKIKVITDKILGYTFLILFIYVTYKIVTITYLYWRLIINFVVRVKDSIFSFIAWVALKLHLYIILEIILDRSINFLVYLKTKLPHEKI